jgi:hypothetical protein
VYEWSPTASVPWTAKTLYRFDPSSTDGISPASGVVLRPKGVLYRTTPAGGLHSGTSAPFGYGTICPLTPGTGSWTETILYNFDDPTDIDAYHPDAALTADSAGNLYGASSGGHSIEGAVFELGLPGTVEPSKFSPVPGTYNSA